MDDIYSQLRIVRRWLPLLIVGAVLAGAVAFMLASSRSETYSSTARLIVDSGPNPTIGDLEVSNDLANQYAVLARTREVVEPALSTVGLDASFEEAREQINSAVTPESPILTIEASASDPEVAAGLAAAISEQLIDLVASRVDATSLQVVDGILLGLREDLTRTQRRVDELLATRALTNRQLLELADQQSRLSELQTTFANLLPLSSVYARHQVAVLDEPMVPADSTRTSSLLLALVAFMAGLLLAAAIAAVIEYLDDRVRHPSDVTKATGLPVLAQVQEFSSDQDKGGFRRVTTVTRSGSPDAEAYEKARVNIDREASSPGTLLFASASASRGRPVVAANIAASYAQSGKRVVLVDADLRQPSLHELFGLSRDRGLTTLAGDNQADPNTVMQPTPQVNLRLIAAGPTPRNPSAVLASNWMQWVVTNLSENADVVIIDSPPIDDSSGAAVLGSNTDATVLVVDLKKGHSGPLQQASETLQAAHANVIGAAVFETVRGSSPDPEQKPSEPVPEPVAGT